jgi:superfamily II DNA/RNA helicase
MDAFKFRDHLVRNYAEFSRSFCKIRASDIREAVDHAHRNQYYWPAPLIQINPNFQPGNRVEELVQHGVLHPECARIFRVGKTDGGIGISVRLHRHQQEAISFAQDRESYVLTTGTGSGKSLSYFIPIIDTVLKAKQTDPTARTRAIIIYPMNALANSQLEELNKFFCDYPDTERPVSYGRYTGQESDEDRQRLADNPPDILLTNFMMLELLMIRQDEKDKKVIANARGLDFLVLDELHTYRGRQGADVALLVRRVREALNPDLLCIGTSATMASEGAEANRNQVVAEVASRLFGALVKPANVITETLKRVTPEISKASVLLPLRQLLLQPLPEELRFQELAEHPMSVWIELALGLSWQDDKWVRARPLTVDAAAQQLSRDTGVASECCQEYLAQFLLRAYQCGLFAFRLHQFISGAGQLYATLEPRGKRYITLEGQQFVPGERDRRLFDAYFCRECGQEYFPVWDHTDGGWGRIEPRPIDEKNHDESAADHGFFMPDEEQLWNAAALENFPETWLDLSKDQSRLKSSYKPYVPRSVQVQPDGQVSKEPGLHGWLIPGSFRFCLCCGTSHSSAGKDSARLGSLSGEGRSSATTMLTFSALSYLYEQLDTELKPEAKKLLGFTDNRQDASLQAGHFNDFLQILIIRSALLAAIERAPEGYLTDNRLTQAVFHTLGFDRDDPTVRGEYMNDDKVSVKGRARRDIEETLRNMLGYRLYFDLRRGWRLNNPNLEQLGILNIDYQDLDKVAADEKEWEGAPALLRQASSERRRCALKLVLDALRQGLCIKTRYLDPHYLEQLKTDSFNNLKEPWAFTEEEKPESARYFITGSKSGRFDPKSRQYADELVSGSSRSMLARELKKPSTWGMDSREFTPINDRSYPQIIEALLKAAQSYGIVERVESDFEQPTYQLNAGCLLWRVNPPGEEHSTLLSRAADNPFFRNLYRNTAAVLSKPAHWLFAIEAREHTAQVDIGDRLEREEQFRTATLPVLFCSPTMELGVDIATLNTVYLRNVPPTPANYAQRSGRAGRAGQPALVLTYCAAKSPHDQYFFRDPVKMVHGQVNPPTLDLANKDLLQSHLNAVWLAETGQKLDNSVKALLDMAQAEKPLRQELRVKMNPSAVYARTHERAARLVSMLHDELSPSKAPWYDADWLRKTIDNAFHEFDQALNRWRDLYEATSRQMELNHKIQMNSAASERERKEAKQRYDEASRQQSLLLQDSATLNSDFYTYRYLASQGFLPGYNFPRLPLLAYIPARRGKIARENFLSRPRFLALSEFGPYSLIYHEGSQYRVNKAILKIDTDQVAEGMQLATTYARLCPECGYGHFREQRDAERCLACAALLADALEIKRLYRIENVSTRRVERITADQEERLRQGYEMQTTLQFALEDNRLQRQQSVFYVEDKPLLELQYGPAATVWRMNLGWRRRKEKSILGFNINPVSGYWTGEERTGEELPPEEMDSRTLPERIVPFVEDRRNVLIVRPPEPLEERTMVTLQYALKRGIESVFQLEESELMVEPLPKRDNCRTILFFEAAEGGAGVLTRLAREPDALPQVAARALEICHYRKTGEQWLFEALDQERDSNDQPLCEAGCYRCLLSYYNQPDHELIDRQDKTNAGHAVAILCQLTRANLRRLDEQRIIWSQPAANALAQTWLAYLKQHGLTQPDEANKTFAELNLHADFYYRASQTAVFIDGMQDPAQTAALQERGVWVVQFPADERQWSAIFAEHDWIFGQALTRSESA